MNGSATRSRSAEAGFTLVEAIVSTVIAVIAVIALAFTFSAGRGMVDRFAIARGALAAAENRMERLAVMGLKDPSNADLGPGAHGPLALDLNGNTTGSERWTVTWVNDPADNAGGDVNPNDYKQVVVTVAWTSGTVQDTVQLTRLILGP